MLLFFSLITEAVYYFMGHKPIVIEDERRIVVVEKFSSGMKIDPSTFYGVQESSVDDETRYYKNLYWADFYSKEEEFRKDNFQRAELNKELKQFFTNKTEFKRGLTECQPTSASSASEWRNTYVCKGCSDDDKHRRWLWENGKMDYTGRDAFRNIQAKLDQSMA